MKTFEVTRKPRYGGDDNLHGTDRRPPDDFLILVDGLEIGGTAWCAGGPGRGLNGGGAGGESWMSWGPRGRSFGHPIREAAVAAVAAAGLPASR